MNRTRDDSSQKSSLQIRAENGPFEPFTNLFHLPQKEAFLITVTSVTLLCVLVWNLRAHFTVYFPRKSQNSVRCQNKTINHNGQNIRQNLDDHPYRFLSF